MAQRLTPDQLDKLDAVIFHLEMLRFGLSKKFDPILESYGLTSPVERFYNTFALMHLITTMFLVDKRNLPMGGFCYRALAELGISDKLAPIQRTLQGRVGNTTLGEFIRHSRNKLGTHGNLDFASLPPEAQAVPGSKRATVQFDRLMGKLEDQVINLVIPLGRRVARDRAFHEKQRKKQERSRR